MTVEEEGKMRYNSKRVYHLVSPRCPAGGAAQRLSIAQPLGYASLAYYTRIRRSPVRF